MRPLLRERVAIVAGIGPDPLGPAIARCLAREGAKLSLAGADAGSLEAVASELRSGGSQATTTLADTSKSEECRRLVGETLNAFGSVDVLVHHVAPSAVCEETLYDADLSKWPDVFESDLLGALRLAQEVLRPMRLRGKGSIVMIGALEMRLTPECSGALPVVHGALLTATRILAREIGPQGIRINTLVPGFTEGPRLRSLLDWRAAREGVSRQELHDGLVAEHALGRLTDPAEVGDAVVFLASDLSRIVTGQSLDVNCGHHFH